MSAFLFCACASDAAVQLRTVAQNLSRPVYVASAKDGSGRLFIVEQEGRIRVYETAQNGRILTAPFLDIVSRVRCCGEMGLLGLAFHPNYKNNRRFFVNYTRDGPAGLETVVAEFSVSAEDANRANSASEKILLTIAQPFTNHNGGMLEFGPDGYLYIGTGDGGSGGDPQGNGQSLDTLLGKILRIDVNTGQPYGIPPDNPFVNAPGRDEIWAYGLRNPWRFSFDRQSGRLFAGDVGQGRREEIDIIVRGGNYGWNRMEGTLCYPSGDLNCNREGLAPPIHDYGRDLGISVTGGYMYRGSTVPSLAGKYLFSDFGSGRLWALSELGNGQWRVEELLRTGLNVSSFGEDENGELYLVDYNGRVFQIVSDGREPTANAQGVVNAASYRFGPVAPGELVSVFGAGLGPGEGAGAQLDETGRLSRLLAGVRVWFDELAAPLLFARSDQINAQVPYGVAARGRCVVQVEFQGALSNPVEVSVAAAFPGVFLRPGEGSQGAILNFDHSPNSVENPARRGTPVVLFATGEGQTNAPGEDGKLAQFPYPTPVLPVSVRIGGAEAAIEFAGSAPGLAGVLQINARVPEGVAPGHAVPVEIRVGGIASQADVTLAVR